MNQVVMSCCAEAQTCMPDICAVLVVASLNTQTLISSLLLRLGMRPHVSRGRMAA